MKKILVTLIVCLALHMSNGNPSSLEDLKNMGAGGGGGGGGGGRKSYGWNSNRPMGAGMGMFSGGTRAMADAVKNGGGVPMPGDVSRFGSNLKGFLQMIKNKVRSSGQRGRGPYTMSQDQFEQSISHIVNKEQARQAYMKNKGGNNIDDYNGKDGALGPRGFTGAAEAEQAAIAAEAAEAARAAEARGYTGPTGPRGYTGPTGPRGWTGNDGARGPRGWTGNDGARGPRGYTGATSVAGKDGSLGPRGFSGISIQRNRRFYPRLLQILPCFCDCGTWICFWLSFIFFMWMLYLIFKWLTWWGMWPPIARWICLWLAWFCVQRCWPWFWQSIVWGWVVSIISGFN